MNEYIHTIVKEIYSSFDNIHPKEQIKKNPDEVFHEFLNDYLFISITKILNSDKKEEEKKELLYFLRNMISSSFSSYKFRSVSEDKFKNFTPSYKEVKHFSKARKEYPLIENIYNQFLDTTYSIQMLLFGKETSKEEMDLRYKEIDQRLSNLPTKFDEDNFTEELVFNLRSNLFRAEGYILLITQELYGKKDLKENFEKTKALFTKKEKIELGENLYLDKAYNESLEKIYERVTDTENNESLKAIYKRITDRENQDFDLTEPFDLQKERKKRRKIFNKIRLKDRNLEWIENVRLAPISNGLNVKNDSLNLIVDIAGAYNQDLSMYIPKLLYRNPQNSILVRLCYQEEIQEDMKSVEEVLEKLKKLSSYPYPSIQFEKLIRTLKEGEDIDENLYGVNYAAGSYFIENLSRPHIESISYMKNGKLHTIAKHEILEDTLSTIISTIIKTNTNQLEVRICGHGNRNRFSIFENGKELIETISPTIMSRIPKDTFREFSLNLHGCQVVYDPNLVEHSSLENTFAFDTHKAFSKEVATNFKYEGKPIDKKNISTIANIYNISGDDYIFIESGFEKKEILYSNPFLRLCKPYSKEGEMRKGFFVGKLKYTNGETEERIFGEHFMIVPISKPVQANEICSSTIFNKIERLIKSVSDFSIPNNVSFDKNLAQKPVFETSQSSLNKKTASNSSIQRRQSRYRSRSSCLDNRSKSSYFDKRIPRSKSISTRL